MKSSKNRAWAEINLGAIQHNYRVICERAKSPVMCVVKANAYGHGAVPIAMLLQKQGAPYFAVATIEEAMELRSYGITKPILILGYVDEKDIETAVRHHITVPVYDMETAQLCSAAAARVGETLKVHYKLDTGMSRLGFSTKNRQETEQQILECAALPGLYSEGIFTHFAIADVPTGNSYTASQFNRFRTICTDLRVAGLNLPLRHCANSAGIQHYHKTHCSMTRAGIILYGCRPDISVPYQLELQQAMTVYARVAQVRELPANTSVGYGRTYTTDKPTRMAVITIGYADGFLRTGTGHAKVLLGGHPAPVLGRICMDMCMVSVPDGVEVKRGDTAVVFGPGKWTVENAAKAAGTISYELLCAISSRVPRFYRAHA